MEKTLSRDASPTTQMVPAQKPCSCLPNSTMGFPSKMVPWQCNILELSHFHPELPSSKNHGLLMSRLLTWNNYNNNNKRKVKVKMMESLVDARYTRDLPPLELWLLSGSQGYGNQLLHSPVLHVNNSDSSEP